MDKKICPKCLKFTLEINLQKGILKCTNCGYEIKLQTGGEK